MALVILPGVLWAAHELTELESTMNSYAEEEWSDSETLLGHEELMEWAMDWCLNEMAGVRVGGVSSSVSTTGLPALGTGSGASLVYNGVYNLNCDLSKTSAPRFEMTGFSSTSIDANYDRWACSYRMTWSSKASGAFSGMVSLYPASNPSFVVTDFTVVAEGSLSVYRYTPTGAFMFLDLDVSSTSADLNMVALPCSSTVQTDLNTILKTALRRSVSLWLVDNIVFCSGAGF